MQSGVIGITKCPNWAHSGRCNIFAHCTLWSICAIMTKSLMLEDSLTAGPARRPAGSLKKSSANCLPFADSSHVA
jgi:hypothetical protein